MHAPVALEVVRLLQERVDARAGNRRQAAVEALRQRPARVVLRVGEVLHLRQPALERRDRLRLQPVDRQPHRLALQRDAHDHELLEVRRRDRLDGHAAVGLRVDEAFALQHPQRLAQRRAAHAKLARELDL